MLMNCCIMMQAHYEAEHPDLENGPRENYPATNGVIINETLATKTNIEESGETDGLSNFLQVRFSNSCIPGIFFIYFSQNVTEKNGK